MGVATVEAVEHFVEENENMLNKRNLRILRSLYVTENQEKETPFTVEFTGGKLHFSHCPVLIKLFKKSIFCDSGSAANALEPLHHYECIENTFELIEKGNFTAICQYQFEEVSV